MSICGYRYHVDDIHVVVVRDPYIFVKGWGLPDCEINFSVLYILLFPKFYLCYSEYTYRVGN